MKIDYNTVEKRYMQSLTAKQDILQEKVYVEIVYKNQNVDEIIFTSSIYNDVLEVTGIQNNIYQASSNGVSGYTIEYNAKGNMLASSFIVKTPNNIEYVFHNT